MAEPSESIQAELVRRHRTAVMVIGAFLGLTVALVGIAFFQAEALYRPNDPSLAMALWITILIFGIGSFVLRRTRFQPARLQDIAALRGLSGLLATLQGTTIQIAFIGGAITLMGFLAMIISPAENPASNKYHMLRAAAIAAIVLISAYPSRSAWQRAVRAAVAEQPGNVDDSPAKGIVA